MDNLYSVFMGIVIGIILTGLILNHHGTPFNTMRTAIEECEKTLPRNQHCKIIAIPDDVIN